MGGRVLIVSTPFTTDEILPTSFKSRLTLKLGWKCVTVVSRMSSAMPATAPASLLVPKGAKILFSSQTSLGLSTLKGPIIPKNASHDETAF